MTLRARLDRLSPEQRRSLEARCRRSDAQSVARPPGIPRLSPREAYPLSFVQERMWVAHQLDPACPVYNRPAGLRLRGPLDVPRLERSLSEVTRRHDVLRASFREVDGLLTQRFAPPAPVRLPLVDLQGAPEDEREARLTALAEADARLPFDLGTGPLYRASLARLDPQDHGLLLTFHHAVFDGWSFEVLVEELATLYGALPEGSACPLPDPPIQYVDFAAWQRERLQGARLTSHLDYWRDRLAGSPTLDLPSDRPRPPSPGSRGGCLDHRLGVPLAAALDRLCQREGVTLFMALLGGFGALLQRYTGQADVVVGVPVAERTCVETERLIGCFINTLPLRMDLGGDPTVRTVLQRVRDASIEAFAHQELPFEKLLEALAPARVPNRSPLFQVLFQLRNLPRTAVTWPGLRVEPLVVGTGTSKVDLSLDASREGDGLLLSCEFNTDLFEPESVARLFGHLETLLQGMVSDPEARLAALPLLTPAERRHVLVELNRTHQDQPRDSCLHHLVEEQARRAPEALAAVHEGRTLTYRQLDARAGRLARRLRALGVGPEVAVGLCVARSLEMVVAQLGILKAGGAYVPFEPDLPEQRTSLLLELSAVGVVVTTPGAFTATARPGRPLAVVVLDAADAAEPDDAALEAVPPGLEPTAGNLAYVMHTSGTSGTPKGVMIEHRSIVNYVLAARERYELAPGERLLQFASFAFDTSVEEIFATLAAGATLVLRTEEALGSAEAFHRACAGWAITRLVLPTSYWHHLCARMEADGWNLPESVRLVAIGGERARPEALAVWLRHAGPRVRLINAYGPTEASVVATWCDLTDHDVALAGPLPIGRPLPNVQALVLDRHLQPVPVGVAGELCLGGRGLARGYLGQPELTAAAFVPNPHDDGGRPRLYRTGDSVRLRADGALVYLGRLDDQLKVAGYRIEPGEVESALRQSPDVLDGVVVACESAAGGSRLVAYVVTRAGAPLEARSLRAFLRERLPDYMVPTAFVHVAKLPLDRHDKVDRRALPAPDLSLPEPGPSRDVPASATEKALARIWADLLHVDEVGLDDDFLALGGDSLLAVRAASRIRRDLGAELPLRTLFDLPTVREQARYLDAAHRAA